MLETYAPLYYWLVSCSLMIRTFLVEHILNCIADRGKGGIDYCRGFGILNVQKKSLRVTKFTWDYVTSMVPVDFMDYTSMLPQA